MPPTLFFVSAGQVHFWQVEVPLSGYSLHFTPELFASSPAHGTGLDILALFHSLSYTPLQLNREQSTFVQQLIEMAAHEFESYDDDSVMNSYLHILFSHIQRLCKSTEPGIILGPAAELVRKYRRLVSLHFATYRSVEYYADQIGVSAAHLSKCVKGITGYTAGQILRQELILEAKRLLINTDWPVEQISAELGFDDPAYFGRFFKREADSSPGAYRRTIFDRFQIKHR
jgi:AraC-like DNA-binding protein